MPRANGGRTISRIVNRRKNNEVSVPVEDSARGHVKTRNRCMPLRCNKVNLSRGSRAETSNYTDRLSSDPRGGGILGRVLGKAGIGLDACRGALVCACTSRIEFAPAEPDRVEVVAAFENAWRELPEIMRMMVPRIYYR